MSSWFFRSVWRNSQLAATDDVSPAHRDVGTARTQIKKKRKTLDSLVRKVTLQTSRANISLFPLLLHKAGQRSGYSISPRTKYSYFLRKFGMVLSQILSCFAPKSVCLRHPFSHSRAPLKTLGFSGTLRHCLHLALTPRETLIALDVRFERRREARRGVCIPQAHSADLF